MHDGWMGGGGFFWAILGFLFLTLLVIGVVIVIMFFVSQSAKNAGRGAGGGAGAGRAALDELEKRYARGEIGRDEFLEKKDDLG